MKTIRTIAMLGLAGALSHLATATVTVNIAAETLRDSVGVPLAQDSLVVLVGSADATFGSLTPNADSFTLNSSINGTDDIVLWKGNLMSGDVGALLESATLNFTSLGSPLALYWFPSLSVSSTSLTAGQSYGFFTDSVGHDSGDAWRMPADGSAISLNFLTNDASVLNNGGFFADNASWAALTVTAVPEPSTYAAILGSMVLGFVGYRRYRRK